MKFKLNNTIFNSIIVENSSSKDSTTNEFVINLNNDNCRIDIDYNKINVIDLKHETTYQYNISDQFIHIKSFLEEYSKPGIEFYFDDISNEEIKEYYNNLNNFKNLNFYKIKGKLDKKDIIIMTNSYLVGIITPNRVKIEIINYFKNSQWFDIVNLTIAYSRIVKVKESKGMRLCAYEARAVGCNYKIL